ncbi:MAG: hypothetical protein AAF415_13900 [Pseudomonadota bacterium]
MQANTQFAWPRFHLMPPWRCFQYCVAAVVAVFVCATSVGADEAPFDYKIGPSWRAIAEGEAAIQPADPDRCGTDFGWMEVVSTTIDASVEQLQVAASNGRIRVRRGNEVKTITARPPRFGYRAFLDQDESNAKMTVEYVGCVTPSGRVLLELHLLVNIDASDGPNWVTVTHQGPPVDMSRWLREAELSNFIVETDLGEAKLTSLELSSQPTSATELHERFSVKFRVQNQGTAP